MKSDLTKKFDLLFQVPVLRKKIQQKMQDLNITPKQLCDEAQEIGIKGLNPSSLSRFFADDKGKREGSITQGILIYILMRLGFSVRIDILEDPDQQQSQAKARIFAKQFVQ